MDPTATPDTVVLPGIDTGATAPLSPPDANVSSSAAGGEAGSIHDDGETPDEELLTKAAREAVERARTRFDYVCSVDDENRQNQLEDTRFAWERWAQWDTTNRRIREMARPNPRPCLEFNQCGPFIKRIVNDQRKNQPSIKIRPAGRGATQEVAKIYSGLIRSIEQDSQAGSIYDTALECAVTGGRGYWRMTTDWESEDSFNQVLKISPLANPQNVFLDPDAKEPDKSDAKYAFVCDWIDKVTYENEWPLAGQAVSWERAAGAEDSDDLWASWFAADKVCVADYYEICEYPDELIALDNGQTMWRGDYNQLVMDQAGAWRQQQLMAGMPALTMMPPLPPQIMRSEKRQRKRVDWYKVTARDTPLAKYNWLGNIIPVVCCVGDEIVIDGKHVYQGVIRRLRDAQMMYNYAYTMMVERVALAPKAPFMAVKGAIEGIKSWQTLNTENHPVLEYNIVTTPGGAEITQAPQRGDSIAVDQGLVTILQLCSENLKAITGQRDQQEPNPETPWRGLVQAARQGDLATFHYGDNLARAIALTGRISVGMIPLVWDVQRAVRMIGIDGSEQEMVVNQRLPAPPGAPPEQATTLNDLKLGRYDAAVETGPSYATRRLEAASEINEFMSVVGPQGAMLVADLFAEVADWPGDVGERVARRLKASLPPNIQQADGSKNPEAAAAQAQLQQMQQQMQQMVQAASAEIKQLKDEIAILKTKNESKRLDFVSSIMETQGKRDDLSTQRFMEAENNASQEFIEKLKTAEGIASSMAKLGYDPINLFPMIFQIVAQGGQGMRRGPDFSDVATAIQTQNDANAQQITGIVADANLNQPDPTMTPPSAPAPVGPAGPPGLSGVMPPPGSGPPNGGGNPQ